MINQEDVIRFFNERAASWDAETVRNEEVIRLILDRAGIREGVTVLDVACGTGVLFPDYLSRNVRSVTGIDISPAMIQIAAEKFRGQEKIRLISEDVEAYSSEAKYDVVMVYNAFPHFPDPERLIRTLCGFLAPGGRLSIAHGASRETIDAHHSGEAALVSNGLMSAEVLSALLTPFLTVETVISDETMYQVVGRKR